MEFEGLKCGQIIRIEWLDIIMDCDVPFKALKNPRYIREITSPEPTFSVGELVALENDSIVLGMELCEANQDDKSHIETIPLGVVKKIEILEVKKTIEVSKTISIGKSKV